MSKRKRVPAPFQRILPNVIRTFGPRLVLIVGGIAALFVFFGGSYLLSRTSTSSDVPNYKAAKKLPTNAPAEARVLGTSTRTPQTNQTMPTPSSSSATTAHDSAESQIDQRTPAAASVSVHPIKNDLQNEAKKIQNSNDDSKNSSGPTVDIDTPLGSLGLRLP